MTPSLTLVKDDTALIRLLMDASKEAQTLKHKAEGEGEFGKRDQYGLIEFAALEMAQRLEGMK